ncbi:hypothetical protein TeGR_g2649 [Tetraparma gracilis]|uniref:CRAL/TRIO N-terminal domain-containing protein n=1 Tax=Tetraparma gracilis TaxID=2962635 RepID=A0ABQ6MNU3_9STRA|nr:hypothetical protein TeGR_g2649 [Tetraparma gracilis]
MSGFAPAAGTTPWTAAEAVAAGVPQEDSELVSQLAARLGLDATKNALEPMSDPTTLLRFLNARDKDLDKACTMYTETMAWRGSSGLAKKMNDHGTIPDLYGADGMQKTDLSSWAWKRATSTPDAALVQRFGFFGRLGRLGPDDEAIIIWRLGAADLKTTGHHEDKILEAFNAHMEDCMQVGRAASLKHKKLVRSRLVIDLNGIGLSAIPYLSVIRKILGLGKTESLA